MTREFTCIICGEKGIDRSATQNKKFCSRRCQDVYWNWKRYGKTNDNPCLYNDGVSCTCHQCGNCGWNPKVIKKRMRALL